MERPEQVYLMVGVVEGVLLTLAGVVLGRWLQRKPPQASYLPAPHELARMVRRDARPGDGSVKSIPMEGGEHGTYWAKDHFCPTCARDGQLAKRVTARVEYIDNDGRAPWACYLCGGRFESHELVTGSQLQADHVAEIARRRDAEARSTDA